MRIHDQDKLMYKSSGLEKVRLCPGEVSTPMALFRLHDGLSLPLRFVSI